jgi:trans-aconitate 2-methyltransferase
MAWNPAQYHKFRAERFAPFEDLFQLITVREGLRAIDLGCGTGELTRRLADRLPGSDVLGLDSSAEMLAEARGQARPGLRFARGAIEDVSGTWDLVFSHAALQWVDDHPALLPRLLDCVAPGGQLAVQLPSNHDHPSHRFAADVAGEAPFAAALGGWTRRSPVLPIAAYAELLYAHAGAAPTVLEKAYPHVLEDAEAICEWTRGTLLVPYLGRLPEALREPFLDAYRARLRARWPRGPVFYPFRRTLFAVTRP